MQPINGKVYPLWSQFVDRKSEWIGGRLIDSGDTIDRMVGATEMGTSIIDIQLEPNGTDSAFFRVRGADFDCGFDVQYGGIVGTPDGVEGLTFSGYGGHSFRIIKPAA